MTYRLNNNSNNMSAKALISMKAQLEKEGNELPGSPLCLLI